MDSTCARCGVHDDIMHRLEQLSCCKCQQSALAALRQLLPDEHALESVLKLLNRKQFCQTMASNRNDELSFWADCYDDATEEADDVIADLRAKYGAAGTLTKVVCR